MPINNSWVENQVRPWAVGLSNWLFAGSLRAGQRTAAIMSLIRSAQLNGLDPLVDLKDVLKRLIACAFCGSRRCCVIPQRAHGASACGVAVWSFVSYSGVYMIFL